MMQPSHILHHLLPEQNSDMKRMATRSSGKEIYNFYCRTERSKGSPIVFAIIKYNERNIMTNTRLCISIFLLALKYLLNSSIFN